MPPKPADSERHWFVAFVMSCREKRVGEFLSRAGYEIYIPVQKEKRRWSDRVKVMDRLVIPRMVFVRCTESERLKAFDMAPGLCGFLNSGEGPGHPAIIREAEMDTFRAIVENGGRQVTFTDETLAAGDRVRIVDGPLAGLECELISVGDSRCIAVRLGVIGTARMDIERCSVRKI